MRISFVVAAYNYAYQFIAKDRILKKDLPERYLHSHLVCVFATSILMWSYTLVAYFYISHPAPWIVGLITSIVHLCSPLLYRFNNSRFFNTNIFLAAGMLHQSVFGFFCGGFLSNIIIWFGILPMLAGVICGRRGVVTWLVICVCITLIFLMLQVYGYRFPYAISPEGLLISQTLVTFGWICTSSIVIWGFLISVESRQKEIEAKNEGIRSLIIVITHDISTPLSIVAGHARLLKTLPLSDQIKSSVDKIAGATNNISSIVNNVRELYAMELGKSKILIETIKLKDLLLLLSDNFSEKLHAKKIALVIEKQINEIEVKANKDLLLHQILGNILSNAIKFSANESEIHINVTQEINTVSISIRDFGIGMPESLAAKIFEVNAQTSRPGTAGEKGTGFGLPIVKAYVDKLNGKIMVHSGPGGTTFIIELPS